MQPRDLWSPPVPDQYVVSDTDKLIAEENARVNVFEHPESMAATPRDHTIVRLVREHRTGFLIILVSILLLGAGTAFGMANIHKFTGDTLATTASSEDSGTSSKKTPTGTSAGSSDEDTGDSEDTGDEGDTADEDTGDSEDTGDEGDTADEDTADSEDTGDEGDDAEGDDGGGDPGEDGQDDTVNPAPTPIPSTPVSSTPHKFTVASWNVKTDNTKNVGTEVIDFLTKSQIIGLQTLRTKAMRDSVKSKVICSSCAYSGYLPSYSGSESGQSDLPIIWNKSAFTVVGSGSFRKMCDAASSKTYSYAARYATWVKLQSKVNNKQFYVVDTHTMGVSESGGKPGSDSLLISRFQTHMTNLKGLIGELKAANIPIFVVGTFNVDYRYDRFGYTSYFPYTSLKSIGIRSSWDLLGLSGISSSTGTVTGSNRLIDYIFTWQRSDVVANSIAISTSTHGSDHYAAYFTNTIK